METIKLIAYNLLAIASIAWLFAAAWFLIKVRQWDRDSRRKGDY